MVGRRLPVDANDLAEAAPASTLERQHVIILAVLVRTAALTARTRFPVAAAARLPVAATHSALIKFLAAVDDMVATSA